MSTKKELQSMPPWFGEAFVDDFFFSSIMNNSKTDQEDVWSAKQYKDFIQWNFIQDDMIKTKFSVDTTPKDVSNLPTTQADRLSTISGKKWGWSAVEYEAERLETNTPMAKKAKKILQITDRPKNYGTMSMDGGDENIYSKVIATNIYSLMNENQKFDKTRPSPTYIDHYEYEEKALKSIHYPMRDLKIREDLNRVECINEKTNNDNKGLKSYLVKELAKNFFKGKASVSLPAYAFDPISNVTAFMNNFRTAPYFLNKAIHISPKSDPEERIKLITAMVVSSLHQNISFKRAFNPILGETFEGYFVHENQATIQDNFSEGLRSATTNQLVIKSNMNRTISQPSNLKNKFIRVYVEQISHHPPVSSYLIEHSEKDYKIFGHFEEDFKRNGNNLEFRIKGSTTIEFRDGDSYSVIWPAKILENNWYMKYDEFIRIEQLNGSDLTSTVFMSDDPEDEVLGISGIIYSRDLDKDFNQNATSYHELDDVNEISCDIGGSWVNSWIIDDRKYWTYKQNIISPLIPVSNPIPSDARYREDLIFIWRDDYLEYAQKWKLALEEVQRKDAALRKKYAK